MPRFSFDSTETSTETSTAAQVSLKHTSGLVLTPSNNIITRQSAKWMSFLPEENQTEEGESRGAEESKSGQSSSPRRRNNWKFWYKNQKLQSYYSKLEKDEATIKEAQDIIQGSLETTEADSKKGKKWHIRLSVDTAARLTLSVNFLLFFLKLAAAVQSGSLAVVSSLIDSTLDLLSGT